MVRVRLRVKVRYRVSIRLSVRVSSGELNVSGRVHGQPSNDKQINNYTIHTAGRVYSIGHLKIND